MVFHVDKAPALRHVFHRCACKVAQGDNNVRATPVLQVHAQVVPLFRGTFLQMWFYRALGAKVGKDCVIDAHFMHDFDMLEIGDGTGMPQS